MEVAMETKIIIANKNHLQELTKMALDLWPDNSYEELFEDLKKLMDKYKNIFLLSVTDGIISGFIHMSIRTDYVEGAHSSPVGYIEGIYVKPQFRRRGVGRLLVKGGEAWAKAKGCSQVGSDIEIDNNTSYDFHRKIGFMEANRLISFIKDID